MKKFSAKLLLLLVLFVMGLNSVNALQVAMSLQDAAKKITVGNNRKVLGARTKQIDGKSVHVIKVLTPDGRMQKYHVDAQTGALLTRAGKK